MCNSAPDKEIALTSSSLTSPSTPIDWSKSIVAAKFAHSSAVKVYVATLELFGLVEAAIVLAGDLVGLFVFEGFVGDGSDLFMFL